MTKTNRDSRKHASKNFMVLNYDSTTKCQTRNRKCQHVNIAARLLALEKTGVFPLKHENKTSAYWQIT